MYHECKFRLFFVGVYVNKNIYLVQIFFGSRVQKDCLYFMFRKFLLLLELNVCQRRVWFGFLKRGVAIIITSYFATLQLSSTAALNSPKSSSRWVQVPKIKLPEEKLPNWSPKRRTIPFETPFVSICM